MFLLCLVRLLVLVSVQKVWHVLGLWLLLTECQVIFTSNFSGFFALQRFLPLLFFLPSLFLLLDRQSDTASMVGQLGLSEHLSVEVLLPLQRVKRTVVARLRFEEYRVNTLKRPCVLLFELLVIVLTILVKLLIFLFSLFIALTVEDPSHSVLVL